MRGDQLVVGVTREQIERQPVKDRLLARLEQVKNLSEAGGIGGDDLVGAVAQRRHQRVAQVAAAFAVQVRPPDVGEVVATFVVAFDRLRQQVGEHLKAGQTSGGEHGRRRAAD